MATRILGPTGSRRRRRFLLGPILLATTLLALFVAGAARAVHDAEFQLDGDVIASTTTNVGGTTQLLDWDSFFNASGTPLALPPGFDASTFDRDFETNPNGTFNKSDSSTWATGSKDTLPITPTNWQCKRDQNLLDKNDIMNAYAASYAPAGGDEILYFALERNGNSGAANVGFWFLQNENVNCESPGGNTPFAGSHTTGDLLVVSEFTQGGTVSTINVYEWVGGPNGSLNPNPVASGADCETTTVPPSDEACATVNRPPDGPTGNGTITTPWLTVNKFSVGHSLEQREFFEGGINLTDTGLGGKCFSTFLASTRASQELGANLHDFSRGQLGVCVAELTTTPKDGLGGDIVDTDGDGLPEVTIGTGAAGVNVTDSANLTVEGADTWSGTLHFFLCGPIATGTCGTGGVEIDDVVPSNGTAVNQDTVMPVLSAPAHLTSVGRYCWRGFFDSATQGVDDQTDSSTGECFEVLPVQPTLTTSAGPDVTLGNPITDNAPLSGTAFRPGTNGPNATYPSINATMVTPADGTITFTLFGPNNCTSVPTGFLPIVRTVNGDGTYTASFTPTQVGTFTWVAVYSGDSPNTLGAGPTGCPDVNEEVVVTDSTSVASEQDWLPNDTATATAAHGSALNGTMTFTLYPTADCTGTPVPGQTYTRTLTNATSLADRTKSTDNSTFKVKATATVSWKVTYDDNNPDITDSPPVCETTSLTIDNDVPVGP
jgi:hypothetical protein